MNNNYAYPNNSNPQGYYAPAKKKSNVPVVTLILIAMNIIWYIIESMYGDTELAIVGVIYGAQYTPLVMSGQAWRLVTSMFVHFGVEHLYGNMISLFILGMSTEKLIGKFRFIVIYLCSGLVGNYMTLVLSLLFEGEGEWVAAGGASGAIFGIFGALAATAIIDKKKTTATVEPVGIVLALIFMFFNSMGSGVNIAAHLFGAIAGFLFGLFTRDHDGNGDMDILQPDSIKAQWRKANKKGRAQANIVYVNGRAYYSTPDGQPGMPYVPNQQAGPNGYQQGMQNVYQQPMQPGQQPMQPGTQQPYQQPMQPGQQPYQQPYQQYPYYQNQGFKKRSASTWIFYVIIVVVMVLVYLL